MRKKAKKRAETRELKLSEDPFLLDDPGGSPLEWVELSLPYLREAVRRCGEDDPWQRAGFAPESDALTERRRRKLQSLSINIETEEERGESVA